MSWSGTNVAMLGSLAVAASLGWRAVSPSGLRSRQPLIYFPERGALNSIWSLIASTWRTLIKQDGEVEKEAVSLSSMSELHLLLDVFEQFVLPLTVSGVCAGNPPEGAALVHRKTHKCLVASSSQTRQNPVMVPELLAIQSAADILGPGSGATSLQEYIMVSTRPLSSLAHEAVFASGVKTVYVIFPGDNSFDINFTPTAPSAGAVRHSNRYQTLHIPEMVGCIKPGMRNFDSEDQMHESNKADQELARAQRRLLVLSQILKKLKLESEKH